MRNFIIGVVVALAVVVFVGGIVAGFGLMNTSADQQPGKLETYAASAALDASVRRRAGNMTNPVPETDANLLEGMTLYAMNCTGCHGTLDKAPSILGQAFYPPAPELIRDASDDPEWHIYYVIKHGVRWTGMPAWSRRLKDDEIWKITAFLRQINKLPPGIQEKVPKPAAQPGQ